MAPFPISYAPISATEVFHEYTGSRLRIRGDYETSLSHLTTPVILEHEGQPFAVVLSYEEYKKLRALRVDEEQRIRLGWLGLERLLEEVHRRPSEIDPDEIEAEITAARQEVRQGHHE